ncbi:hypothetical protein B7494_g4894 [Chlorociboria aeruginascens]|nr:hypothetical protein B7494_g4894 [Chlorociboria aeruginascens]
MSPSLERVPVSPPPTTARLSEGLALDAPSNDRPDIAVRELVRLTQCPQCSRPLQDAFTLPCGRSLCQSCIPELRLRQNITYPGASYRSQGFTCPFSACAKDHAMDDCSRDVVVNKILDAIGEETRNHRKPPETSDIILERGKRKASMSNLQSEDTKGKAVRGGRFAATYTLAETGELAYDSDIPFRVIQSTGERPEESEQAVLGRLENAIRQELYCSICFELFLEPVTTTCGHTYCRHCVYDAQNTALGDMDQCPWCRKDLAMPPTSSVQDAPSNNLLSELLTILVPEILAMRAHEVKTQEMSDMQELNTPLFMCAVSYPMIPTYLHVFEPRYRLMIQRAMENVGEFGMVSPNQRQEVQGELDVSPFCQYGTLLRIVDFYPQPDGRSYLKTVGVSRFRVLKYDILDGYFVGKTERINDISLAEEEALEAKESTSDLSSHTQNVSAVDLSDVPWYPRMPDGKYPIGLATMPTQDLMRVCLDFSSKMKEARTSWIEGTVFAAFGQAHEDPVLFPWWFASVLPLTNSERYELLEKRSVRERLKLCVWWIFLMETKRQYDTPQSSVFSFRFSVFIWGKPLTLK